MNAGILKNSFIVGCVICFSSIVEAQQTSETKAWRNRWEQVDLQQVSSETLLHVYSENRNHTGLKEEEQQQNDCYFIWNLGEYFMSQKGKVTNAKKCLREIPEIDLKSPVVEAFMEKVDLSRFVNNYFMLRALREGATFDEARDGIDMSTEFPSRSLNRYDYGKLETVFKSGGEKLQILYLNKLPYLFRNAGCTDGLSVLKPVIEKYMADIPARTTVLDLYARYEPLRAGNPAPMSVLQDASGKSYRWSDFAGKVIVVDVWATWCCACIERMPHFLKLREEFAGNPDVLFLSVSIDRRDAWEKWQKALITYKMTPMLNLIAVSGESSFESDYCVAGVPRHIVIDKKGNIVDVFAPIDEEELKKMIERTVGGSSRL